MNITSALHRLLSLGQSPDVAHIVAPGQKYSPAVQAQNNAPIRNQYNAQGQPTYEVLNNMPSISALYGRRPAPTPVRPMGNLDNPIESQPMQAHSLSYGRGVQGFTNMGITPMQTGGYANQLQAPRRFNQQAQQVGVTTYSLRGLLQ